MQISIREARETDAFGIAHAFVDSMRTAYRDLGPAGQLTFSYEESERNWRRSILEIQSDKHSRECIYVAQVEREHSRDAEIVGVAMGGPERTEHPLYAGEVYVLAVVPTYHRQGVGHRLVKAVAHQLSTYSMGSLLIRVLDANTTARKFYEALGGQLVLEEQIVEDDLVLEQVGYGWADIQLLVGNR
ncbi:MAG TPA: GNAT family N-acetyltransferase [Chloroflexia bacterium]|nr:GNAT family N-acetyltransferase [Chloroflexia bacterium]